MTSAITPQICRPLPAAEHLLPRTDGGYSCHEVAVVTHGEFTGRGWRHIHHDSDGTRFDFDATSTALSTRRATALAMIRSGYANSPASPGPPRTSSARLGHGSGIRRGVGGLPDGFTTMEPPPRGVGRGFCHEFVTRTSRGRFPTPPEPSARHPWAL